jgi:hypothetical protein
MASCSTSRIETPLISDMAQILHVVPYVQKKIKSECGLKKFDLFIYNNNKIRAMVYDEDFVSRGLTSDTDSVCNVLAKKIKIHFEERDSSFLSKYDELVVTLCKSGDHLIKGSTIDINRSYKLVGK